MILLHCSCFSVWKYAIHIFEKLTLVLIIQSNSKLQINLSLKKSLTVTETHLDFIPSQENETMFSGLLENYQRDRHYYQLGWENFLSAIISICYFGSVFCRDLKRKKKQELLTLIHWQQIFYSQSISFCLFCLLLKYIPELKSAEVVKYWHKYFVIPIENPKMSLNQFILKLKTLIV